MCQNHEDLTKRMFAGEMALHDGLLEEHNEEACDADGFRYCCPECAALALDEDPDDMEQDSPESYCKRCRKAFFHTCKRCEEELPVEEFSLDYPKLCDCCAEEHREEQISNLRDEIGDLLDDRETSEATIELLRKIKKMITKSKTT